MRTPDDQLNKKIGDALRRRFDQFETQPEPRLEMSIFDRLRVLGQSSTTRHLLAICLLITFILSATLTGQSISMPGRKKLAAKVQRDNANPTPVRPQKKAAATTLFPKMNAASMARYSAQTGNSRVRVVEKLGKEESKLVVSDSPEKMEGTYISQRPTNELTDLTYIHPIQPISHQSFLDIPTPNALAAMPDPAGYANLPLAHTKKENAWQLLLSVTPTNTFQTLTINPHSDVVYQNFQLPALVSSQSLGYKVSAGLEKKGFQFLLTYGQLRQSVRYEIATDEFLVEQAQANDYRVVRLGTPVEDRNTFKFAGLAIKKHTVLRSGPFRRYYGDLGLEASRELTHGQGAAWVNLGIGKEFALDNRTCLRVGPYLEYSLSKLLIPVNNFQIQPYQIGLSIGVSYSKR